MHRGGENHAGMTPDQLQQQGQRDPGSLVHQQEVGFGIFPQQPIWCHEGQTTLDRRSFHGSRWRAGQDFPCMGEEDLRGGPPGCGDQDPLLVDGGQLPRGPPQNGRLSPAAIGHQQQGPARMAQGHPLDRLQCQGLVPGECHRLRRPACGFDAHARPRRLEGLEDPGQPLQETAGAWHRPAVNRPALQAEVLPPWPAFRGRGQQQKSAAAADQADGDGEGVHIEPQGGVEHQKIGLAAQMLYQLAGRKSPDARRRPVTHPESAGMPGFQSLLPALLCRA